MFASVSMLVRLCVSRYQQTHLYVFWLSLYWRITMSACLCAFVSVYVCLYVCVYPCARVRLGGMKAMKKICILLMQEHSYIQISENHFLVSLASIWIWLNRCPPGEGPVDINSQATAHMASGVEIYFSKIGN